MQRSTQYITRPPFIVDESAKAQDHGHQVSWDDIPASASEGGSIVTVITPGALPGATSVPVGALTQPLPAGKVLDFGQVAAFNVTVGVAGAAIGATSIPVAALPGPIPVGKLLDFGAGKKAEVTTAALAGATAVVVEALVTAVVSGDVAPVAADAKAVRLSAAAAVGAVALVVDAIGHELAIGDLAQVAGDPRLSQGVSGFKFVQAGSVMCELTAGANKGKLILRRARPSGNTDPANVIILTNANEPNGMFGSDALSGYGVVRGAVVHENLLPDADLTTGLIPTDYKTELKANGYAWAFLQYNDSRT